jgi:hypothetical protein
VRYSSPIRGLGVLGIGLLASLAAPGIAPAAETSLVIEAQDVLQLSVDQRRRLARGEVISYPVTENSDSEIAVGLAVFMPAQVSQLAQYLVSGQLIAQDASISEFAAVPDEVSPGSLVGPRFTSGEREEAESLLEASPGTRFNLSLAEVEVFRAVRGSAGGSVKTGAAEIGSDTYRRLLQQRVQTYRQGGLAGIAPYARSGGAVTDPAADLRLAASDAERLGHRGIDLREALLRYPADQPAQMVSQLYWIKRRVQRRPHLSLLHRMVVTGDGSIIHVERYFYVGHSFNSIEILTGALAYQDGTLVFSTTRVSTDEVLGMGNHLKRTVARGQVRDEMRARLDRLRAAFTKPVVPESP